MKVMMNTMLGLRSSVTRGIRLSSRQERAGQETEGGKHVVDAEGEIEVEDDLGIMEEGAEVAEEEGGYEWLGIQWSKRSSGEKTEKKP